MGVEGCRDSSVHGKSGRPAMDSSTAARPANAVRLLEKVPAGCRGNWRCQSLKKVELVVLESIRELEGPWTCAGTRT